MADKNAERDEAKLAHATLVRLANSCEREANRGKIKTTGSDLNEDDLRTIADILRKFAGTIANEAA